MTHCWNTLFDGIYCLNLASRPDRMEGMEKRFKHFDLKVERANAIPGAIVKSYWSAIQPTNKYFTNPNYLACAISHVQMYATALARKQKSILVIEDDVRIHPNSDRLTREFFKEIPADWDLLYFAYIPLSDDQSMWTYAEIEPNRVGPTSVKAHNLWSMMGYAMSERMMKHMVEVYGSSYPMEVDRYLVNIIQRRSDFKCYAVSPQCIASEDGYSDNAGVVWNNLSTKSVDSRFAKFEDYI
jgi:GR25 family glycosyltransferase involved in LPS biosynthesis